MVWVTIGAMVFGLAASAYALKSFLELDSLRKKMDEYEEKHDYALDELSACRSIIRDKNEELQIAIADKDEAIGVWKDRYLEAVNVHSLLADEREQSIGDRHDLVILGDQDVFVAYYHGELVVGQKRMSFNGYEDDTYRFEVTFGNTKDEGNVIYYDGGDY